MLFAPHAVEYHARYGGLTARQRVFVAPDADVEIRHLTLSSEGRRRRVTVVGYGEVVLGDARRRSPPSRLQQAVRRERVPRRGPTPWSSTAGRARPTSARATSSICWRCRAPGRGLLGYDSARAAFIGRGGTDAAPAALAERPCRLSRTTGATLDPVMIARRDDRAAAAPCPRARVRHRRRRLARRPRWSSRGATARSAISNGRSSSPAIAPRRSCSSAASSRPHLPALTSAALAAALSAPGAARGA